MYSAYSLTLMQASSQTPIKDCINICQSQGSGSSRADTCCFMWLWPLLLLAVASYGSFDFGEQRVSIFLNMEKIKAVPES